MSDESTKRVGDLLEAQIESWQQKLAALTPEQRAERERAMDESRQREHGFRVKDILRDANLPKRQTQNNALDRTGEWAKTEENISGYLGRGFLIALIGGRGNGKTQLGVELIRRNAQDYRHSRYCTAMEFFMEIKAGYKEDGDAERLIVHRFATPSLLVMDEIGRRSENDWENRLLYELLNRRYNEMKDTLLVSNQDATQLESALGPSLVSRMRETGGVIECNWESYRK